MESWNFANRCVSLRIVAFRCKALRSVAPRCKPLRFFVFRCTSLQFVAARCRPAHLPPCPSGPFGQDGQNGQDGAEKAANRRGRRPQVFGGQWFRDFNPVPNGSSWFRPQRQILIRFLPLLTMSSSRVTRPHLSASTVLLWMTRFSFSYVFDHWKVWPGLALNFWQRRGVRLVVQDSAGARPRPWRSPS